MAYANYFLSQKKPSIDPEYLAWIIRKALAEDVGCGDITSQMVLPANKTAKAKVIAGENFLACGINVAEKVFRTVDNRIKIIKKTSDGKYVKKGSVLIEIIGPAKSILTAERTALNLLAFMSGVATKTNVFIKKIRPFKAKITDTRKTFPGLRILEKYAVRIGGGSNHRLRLDEMVLIKDNHLKLEAKLKLPRIRKVKIEVEAQSLSQFKKILELKPDVIMLDNMSIPEIKKAVKLKKRLPVKLEASGGINLSNVRKFASTGVDIISVGELTDSVKSVDISLDIA